MTRHPALALALGSALVLGACSGSSDEGTAAPSSPSTSSSTSASPATSATTSSDSASTSSGSGPAPAGTGLDCTTVPADQLATPVGSPGQVQEVTDDSCSFIATPDSADDAPISLSWDLEKAGTTVKQAAGHKDYALAGGKTSSHTLEDGTPATLVTIAGPDKSASITYLFVEIDGGRVLKVTSADVSSTHTPAELTRAAEAVALSYTS